MRVLILSPYPEKLLSAIAATGDVICYGYRHILGPAEIEAMQGRIINLHISLLPWNRGADPNFWSVADQTPSGVTIHVIDEGIDTGPILFQSALKIGPDDTLSNSYWKLRSAVEVLFRDSWPAIRAGKITARPQTGPGSSHHSVDKDRFFYLLPDGWDTTVKVARKIISKHRE